MAGYLGNAPTAVPLTSADITDGIITNADIANSTINLTTKVTGSLPVANGGTGLTALGSGLQVLRTNSGATALEFATVSGTTFGSALFHVRDEKSQSTHGGASTSGSFQTRVLNTSLTNEISGASLSSNQITLPSGTYYIIARQAFWGVNYYVKPKWRNTTDSSDVLLGDSVYMDSGTAVTNFAAINGRFTIAAQKTFELQYRVDTGVATVGLGHHTTYGTEVYADVQIWKVS